MDLYRQRTEKSSEAYGKHINRHEGRQMQHHELSDKAEPHHLGKAMLSLSMLEKSPVDAIQNSDSSIAVTGDPNQAAADVSYVLGLT